MSADIRNLSIKHESEKALLVIQRRGSNREETQCWLPKSQIDYIKRHGIPGPDGLKQCDVKIPEWLADEKGLDY